MGQFVRFTYDNRGSLLTVADQRDNLSTFQHDELFRVTGYRDPLGRQATIQYDTTIAPGAETYTYGYDTLSRRTSLQRPNGVRTSYAWDQVDRLARLTHTNARGPALEDSQYGYNLDDEIALSDSLASASKRGGAGHSS